jgi:hypothetical protein
VCRCAQVRVGRLARGLAPPLVPHAFVLYAVCFHVVVVQISSFWNQALSWQIFFCAMMATTTTDLILSSFAGFNWLGKVGDILDDHSILFHVSTSSCVPARTSETPENPVWCCLLVLVAMCTVGIHSLVVAVVVARDWRANFFE